MYLLDWGHMIEGCSPQTTENDQNRMFFLGCACNIHIITNIKYINCDIYINISEHFTLN